MGEGQGPFVLDRFDNPAQAVNRAIMVCGELPRVFSTASTGFSRPIWRAMSASAAAVETKVTALSWTARPKAPNMGR